MRKIGFALLTIAVGQRQVDAPVRDRLFREAASDEIVYPQSPALPAVTAGFDLLGPRRALLDPHEIRRDAHREGTTNT